MKFTEASVRNPYVLHNQLSYRLASERLSLAFTLDGGGCLFVRSA